MTIIFGLYIAQGQIINPKDKIKDKTTNKTNQKIDEGIDAGINAIEDGIGSIFKKKDKKEKKEKKSNTKSSTGNSKNNSNSDDTDFSEYKGSTFIPGKDVLYFDNFSTANLNDGPGNWWTISEDGKIGPSIVTLGGSSDNWLRFMEDGYYYPNDMDALPEDVTVEFDAYADESMLNETHMGFVFQFFGNKNRKELINDWGIFSFFTNHEPTVQIDIHPHPNNNKGTAFLTISKKDNSTDS
ncbi:MAG: hypothetical protein PHC38_02130, partial [Weeksellaceae bacterium]|nr:hypothetical protein [Weeksellaceae bacterium]